MKFAAFVFFTALIAGFLATAFIPSLDIATSALFYRQGAGFFMETHPLFVVLHETAVIGAWRLGYLLTALAALSLVLRRPIVGVTSKGWLFLLLALLIGPVLIANGVLKDHWGRERPHEIVQFGGTEHFTPALEPRAGAERNGSFVSGDGAFGFFLTCFAYIVPLGTRHLWSRLAFWGGMAAGGIFAFTRLAMGGHFLSDNLAAALLMLAIGAGLHTAMFGRAKTSAYWREWTSL